jgi:hypothetical protein
MALTGGLEISTTAISSKILYLTGVIMPSL